ncbi:hypothetical protein GCM10010377_45030 [Streptomyces viridiviolaceus]|nr:hypothetical protein GCM10010377_45030 [Streptomyces viridiviolaceus]
MITELAVERLEFTCGQQVERRLRRAVLPRRERDEWEYFGLDGHGVPSLYDPEGAPPCPICGGCWVGNLICAGPRRRGGHR